MSRCFIVRKQKKFVIRCFLLQCIFFTICLIFYSFVTFLLTAMKQINFKFNICNVFFPTFFCHLLICNIFFTAMKQINFKFSICNISFRKYSDFTIKCLRKKRVFQKRRYFGAPKNERKNR